MACATSCLNENLKDCFTSVSGGFYEQFTKVEIQDVIKSRPHLQQIKDCLARAEVQDAMKSKSHPDQIQDCLSSETIEDLILRILNGTWQQETLLPRDWDARINYHALFGSILKNTTAAQMSADCPLLVAKCNVPLAEHFANIAQKHKNMSCNGDESTKEASFQQFGEQMVQLNQTIKTEGPHKEMTAAVAVDMNKMHHNKGWFHSDWNKGVLQAMEKAGIGGQMYNMIKAMIATPMNLQVDPRLKAAGYVPPSGHPADSPLNQTLWKLYTNDMLNVTKSKSTYFGDDLVFSRTGRHLQVMEKGLNDDLQKLRRYCQQKKFDMHSPHRMYYILK